MKLTKSFNIRDERVERLLAGRNYLVSGQNEAVQAGVPQFVRVRKGRLEVALHPVHAAPAGNV